MEEGKRSADRSQGELEALQRRLGASATLLEEGRAAALHYGSWEAEHRRLREGLGLAIRTWVECLEVTGEDRRRFLNGMVTCDVLSLQPGKGAFGFFTDAKGHILSEAAVLCLEDRFRLLVPGGRGGPLIEHLSRYVVTDRVETIRREEIVALTLAGRELESKGAEVLGARPPSDPWEHRPARLAGVEAGLVREARLGAPASTLLADLRELPDLVEELCRKGSGLEPCGFQALETLRVEAGLLRYGRDFAAESFPQETGVDEAVSYEKGCYLGQEVIARIHYRGGVNRAPRGLVFAAGSRPEEGAAVSLDGGQVGKATSVVLSPALDRPVALAILHHRATEPGTEVEVEGAGPAVVRLLPLAAAR